MIVLRFKDSAGAFPKGMPIFKFNQEVDAAAKSSYNVLAVLDGELAVPCNLQSATAGLNSLFEVRTCGVWRLYGVLMAGSCATHTCESCQVLTEAALSGELRVPRACLTGATGRNTARKRV